MLTRFGALDPGDSPPRAAPVPTIGLLWRLLRMAELVASEKSTKLCNLHG